MTDNWTENRDRTLYKHKANPKMIVQIMETNAPEGAKYFVYHTHPGYGGIVIPQKLERATTMKHARELAEVHMKHWNDSTKWCSDPDFGKAN
jgi:hypothetical protein